MEDVAPAARVAQREDGAVVCLRAPMRSVREEEMVDADLASPVPEQLAVRSPAVHAAEEEEDEDEAEDEEEDEDEDEAEDEAEEEEESAEAHSSGTSSSGKRSASDLDGACMLRRRGGGLPPLPLPPSHPTLGGCRAHALTPTPLA